MDNEVLEIQNLDDDDLLHLYDLLDAHIKYLRGSILDSNDVEVEEESEGEPANE